MKPSYLIRLATTHEIQRLTHIEKRAAALFEDYDLAVLFSSIVTPTSHFADAISAKRLWVATDPHNTPIGFALACVVGDWGHLDELDVLPEYGRRALAPRSSKRSSPGQNEWGLMRFPSSPSSTYPGMHRFFDNWAFER